MSNSADFANVASRIETLTSMLRHMKHKTHPRSEKDKIPSFLRHFAILLTCGGINDSEARKVIAVTGSFESNERVKTLVVIQNPSTQTKVEQLDIKRVTRGNDTFDEVVMRHPNADSLHQHIADLRVVLSSCDPEDERQVKALQTFVVARCYRKIRTRFQLYEKLFKAQLDNEIAKWEGLGQELETQWINVPDWLVKLLRESDHMNSRTVGHSGKTTTQWEFSDDTKRTWAMLLARILRRLSNAFDAARTARKKVEHMECRPTEDERKAYEKINQWLVVLWSYVQARHNVVKILLTKTSLGSTLARINRWSADVKNEKDLNDSADMQPGPSEVENENDLDESADMQQEPSEEPGEYVLRYLQTIVAWHSAINAIVVKSRGVFDMKDVDIGVVEVPYHKPGPLTTVNEMQKEYIRRKPGASGYLPLLENNFPSRFGGTVHAEAALMGLMAYSSTDRGNVNYGERVGDMKTLREILLPATVDMNIAVGKKCCWCCDRLGYHLGQYLGSEFNLPGTHGILFAWSPPRIGIDVSVLKMLENDLWDELHSALRARARPSVSRQSSGESTEADDRFTSVDDDEDDDL